MAEESAKAKISALQNVIARLKERNRNVTEETFDDDDDDVTPSLEVKNDEVALRSAYEEDIKFLNEKVAALTSQIDAYKEASRRNKSFLEEGIDDLHQIIKGLEENKASATAPYTNAENEIPIIQVLNKILENMIAGHEAESQNLQDLNERN